MNLVRYDCGACGMQWWVEETPEDAQLYCPWCGTADDTAVSVMED